MRDERTITVNGVTFRAEDAADGDIFVYRVQRHGLTTVSTLEATIAPATANSAYAVLEDGDRLSLWGENESLWLAQVAAAVIVRLRRGRTS